MAERSRRRPYGRVHLSLVVLVLLALGLAVDRISADASASAGNPTPAGVVVEIAQEEYAAHRAGLRPGDVLLRWERAAVPPANPEAAAGILRSPFDLDEVEIEQAPRGPLTLWGTRDGATLKVNLTPQKWKLWTRPAFTPDELAAYERAEALVAQEAHREGFSVWRRMAEAASAAGAPVQAAWLHLRIVDAASKQRDWDVVDRELEQAKHQAEASGEEAVILMARDLLAKSFRDRNDFVRAIARYREVLELRQANAASGLGKAMSLNDLGVVSWYRGDLVESESYFRRALALRERLAPGSRHVADSLNNLAGVARYRGDLAAAEAMYRHSMAIQELLPPTIDFAGCLLNLGNVLSNRGDLVTAERTFRRALAIMEEISPHHPAVAMTLNSLGVLALRRGDLGASEDFHQRALAIKQRLGLEGLSVAASLSSLGNVAMARDELETAGGYLRRALAIWDELAPQSPDVAKSLASLGKLALELGDVDTAERYAQRGFDIVDQLTPMGLATADSLLVLGDIAFARSDLDTTEAHYERALAIRRERVPGSSAIAAACHRLATLHRRSSRPEAALTSYRCAVEALEAQRTKLGGSEEVRAGFGVRYASAYREAIDLLVSMGNTAEAFHLLERYRARELLDLLAERDLVFASDLPAELSRRRRSANKDYDRAFRHWMQLPDHVSAEQQQQARQALEQARRRQDTIRAEVHAAAPRLAALQDPQPLDLAATRAMLEAGTLLLSYSVGEEQSYLFAVEPDRVEANVVALDVGKAALQAEIERFRTDLERGRIDRRLEKALLPARRLSERLLAPVADQLARADRLLILADGPLHSLPFAALTDPTTANRRRFLIESMPLHRAASATVFARLKQERDERRATRLAAFGDPHYPTSLAPNGQAAPPSPPLQAALRGGLDLKPLPATRSEILALAQLYPQTAQVYLGAEATEGRAKTVGRETTHLHIASHGLLDDRFPLDSALALTIPSSWREGDDNGLLQAWEIFEQVRIDADLVTLSACDTGRGKVLGGEGLIGLTRAFQYAGARSVLASLWGVGDHSTAELMQRFYRSLEQGEPKAEALRRAQLELLHGAEYSHPFHWAGFELVGDWR